MGFGAAGLSISQKNSDSSIPIKLVPQLKAENLGIAVNTEYIQMNIERR